MITKRWAGILRQVITDAREDANTAGTRDGGYNVFRCWRPNMSCTEMAVKMDAYDKSYQTALYVRALTMNDSERKALSKLMHYWRTDDAGRERLDILARVEALENAAISKN